MTTQAKNIAFKKPSTATVAKVAKTSKIAPDSSPGAALGRDVLVPWNLLSVSEANARKTQPGGIEELAALIESQGLMQRLSVVDAGDSSRMGVVAGGRRYLAIGLLIEAGKLPVDHPVECKLYESERAVELSLTENSGREAMHPADQMDGFKRLIEQGQTVAQVAGRFGVSVLTVERRLKLSRLSPRFLGMYREAQIDTEQLMALALVDDHARQEAAWDSLNSYSRSAYRLREALTEEEMEASHELAKFVGIDAYEANGGAVRRDLFATEEDGGYYLQNPALVNSLALAKLNVEADKVRAEGWLWVEVSIESTGADYRSHGREQVGEREPTTGEAAALQALEEASVNAHEAAEAFSESADEDADDYQEQSEVLEQAANAAAEAANDARGLLDEWTPEQLSRAGALVKLGYRGTIEINRGLVRPADKQAAIKAMKDSGQDVPSAMAKGTRAEFSEKLFNDLTSHRTGAIQAALTQNPRVALVVLTNRMASALFDDYNRDDGGVKLSLHVTRIEGGKVASEFAESQAARVLDDAETQWGDRLPGTPAARFNWLKTQDESVLLELLAFCTARSFNVVVGNARKADHSDVIADALGVDMADWWTPTEGRFFSHVSKAKAIEVVGEATGFDAAKEFGAMKKAEATAYSAAKLENTRWLPSPLRAMGTTQKETE